MLELHKIVRLVGSQEQNQYCTDLGLKEGCDVLVEEKRHEIGIAVLKTGTNPKIECPLIMLDIIHIEKRR